MDRRMYAVTEDGKRFVLNSDGTWDYEQALPAQNGAISNDGFRGVQWGAGIEQTKYIIRGEPACEDAQMLSYPHRVAAMSCDSIFVFINNKLVRGLYFFKEDHSNKKDYVRDYWSLTELLEQKYGKPKEDETWWKDDLFAGDPDEWGTAVVAGHLVFFANWETPTTKVYTELKGDNYQAKLFVEYMSKEYESLIDENAVKAKLSDL